MRKTDLFQISKHLIAANDPSVIGNPALPVTPPGDPPHAPDRPLGSDRPLGGMRGILGGGAPHGSSSARHIARSVPKPRSLRPRRRS